MQSPNIVLITVVEVLNLHSCFLYFANIYDGDVFSSCSYIGIVGDVIKSSARPRGGTCWHQEEADILDSPSNVETDEIRNRFRHSSEEAENVHLGLSALWARTLWTYFHVDLF